MLGNAPFVLEVTSDTTQKKDLGDKKAIYQRLGVDEYFLFDPLGDYLKPRLQGYRLGTGGRYRAVAPNLTFRMWKDVSHFLMMEKPAEFNSELRGFITSNKLF